MQKFKSVLSLSQTREQLGLNDDEIVVYTRLRYLHPLIKFDIDNEGNIICEDFFSVKNKSIGYFHYDIIHFNDEICFDCREIQALRDKLLDLDKVGNHCPDVKPDPEYVPEWERTIIDPAFVPMAPERPALPYAPTPPRPPIGGQQEAQDKTSVAELERENQGLKDEIERLKKELARKNVAQGQGDDAEQAEAMRKELEDTKAKLQDALEGHGLLSQVLKRKIEGEPWETTKAWLHSLGLSGSNIGLFLREKVLGDPGYRAAARNGKPKK